MTTVVAFDPVALVATRSPRKEVTGRLPPLLWRTCVRKKVRTIVAAGLNWMMVSLRLAITVGVPWSV